MSESNITKLDGCLYFSANSLARHLNKMADEAFSFTDMAPAYSYVMLIILEDPGTTQVRIAKRMNLKASTITRFVDKLMKKGFVERTQEGRNVHVHPTQAGKDFKVIIEEALVLLHVAYVEKLGKKLADKVTANIREVNAIIEK